MIEVKDIVRDSRGWEGEVVAVDGDTATVMISLLREEQEVPVAELEYNTWDPKHPDNQRKTP